MPHVAFCAYACHVVLKLIRVTGKQMHEIRLPTCKTLDEVTTLLGSLAIRQRKYLGKQLQGPQLDPLSVDVSLRNSLYMTYGDEQEDGQEEQRSQRGVSAVL